MVFFSFSYSMMTWPFWIRAPSGTFHSLMVPSTMVNPAFGIGMSIRISVPRRRGDETAPPDGSSFLLIPHARVPHFIIARMESQMRSTPGMTYFSMGML